MAFNECINLSNVILPKNITSIGERAFYACNSLTNLEISNNVRTIGKEAFTKCMKLTIYCETEEKPTDFHINWASYGPKVIWGGNQE